MNRESGEAGTGCALDVGPRASAPEWGVSQSAEWIQGFRWGCLRDLLCQMAQLSPLWRAFLPLALYFSLSTL